MSPISSASRSATSAPPGTALVAAAAAGRPAWTAAALAASAIVAAVSLAASSAAAQVTVVEEREVEAEQVVERGTIQERGRGVQYGAHFVSPVFLTDFRRAGGGAERLLPGGGFGIRARVGWEFPSGFVAEVYGGVGLNGVDTEGAMRRDMMIVADVGVAARYMFWNDSAFVPFVQLGVGLRYLDIEWPSGDGEDDTFTLPLHAAVGAQIELTPYFGIELGALVDYTFGLGVLEDGVVVLTPFAGVTLYVYDEDDPI